MIFCEALNITSNFKIKTFRIVNRSEFVAVLTVHNVIKKIIQKLTFFFEEVEVIHKL